MDVFDLTAVIKLDSSDYENGLAKAEASFSRIGQTMSTVSKVGAAAVGVATAAVGGFVKSSVSVGQSFDSAMAQVGATMLKSADEMEQEIGTVDLAWGTFSGNLRDYAKDIGANTAFSATQAAEALNYMALAGYDTQKSMEMLPKVLNMAQAGNMDLARASDMVTDASSALGLTSRETGNLISQMAMAASKSNTSVEQLGDAILTVGGTAKSMVGGTTEIAAALGILADNGIKGAEGGTALRNVLKGIQTNKFDKSFGKLGVSAYDADGNMRPLKDTLADMNAVMANMSEKDRTKLIMSAFNAYDLKSVNALLGTSEERWIQLSDAIDSAWYSVDSMDEQLRKLTSLSFDSMSQGLEKIGIDAEELQWALMSSGGDAELFAEGLREMVDEGVSTSDVIQALGGDLDSLQRAFDATSGAAESMAGIQKDTLSGAITQWRSALEAVQITISEQVTPALKDFVSYGTESLSTLNKAFTDNGLDGAFDALPGIIEKGLAMVLDKIPLFVDAGVRILGAIGIGLINNLDLIIDAGMQIVSNLWDSITSSSSGQGAMIGEQLIMTLWSAITRIVPSVIAEGTNIVKGLADNISSGFKIIDDSGVKAISAFINGITNQAGDLLYAGLDLVSALVDGIFQNVPYLIETGGLILAHVGEGLVEGIPAFLEHALTIVGDFAGYLRSSMGDLVDIGLAFITNIADGIINSLPVLIEMAPQIITDFAGIINDNAPKVFETGVTIIWHLVQGIISAIPTIVENLPQIFTAIVSVLMAFDWLNLGGTLVRTIGSGIKTAGTVIVNLLKNIGQTALNTFSNPSNWIAVGKFVISTLGSAIRGVVGLVVNALKGVGTSALSGFRGLNWAGIGRAVIGFISSAFNGAKALVVTALRAIGSNALNAFRNINWPGVGRAVINFIGSAIRGATELVTMALKSVGTRAMEAFKNINWRSVGSAVVDGIKNGISNGAKRVADAAKSLASRAFNAAKDFLGIHSPSTKGQWLGDMFGEGFGIGEEKNDSPVKGAIKKMREVIAGVRSVMPKELAIPIDINRKGLTGLDFEDVDDGESIVDRDIQIKSMDEEPGQSLADRLDRVIELLESYLPEFSNMDIVLSNGALVGELTPGINDKLGLAEVLATRGV